MKKDKECKAYINTYKCDSESCDNCEYRYKEYTIISSLEDIAIQTDCPIYKGDMIDDYYIRLSDVISIIENKEEPWANYETVRSDRLDCEVPSDCFEQIKEVRVIDEWTEETKVFKEYSADTPQKSANGWIPCSERLPEEKGEYLVTLKTGVVTSAIYDLNENRWVDAMEEYFEYHCIAWQPLPAPYISEKAEWKDKVMKHFTSIE